MNLLIAFALALQQAPTWDELGSSAGAMGILQGGACESRPTAAFDVDGNPVVAWLQASDSAQYIYLRKWDGQSWVEVGGTSGSGTGVSGMSGDRLAVREPRLVIDASGTYFLIWQAMAADQRSSNIYLRRYSRGGLRWDDLGGSSTRLGLTNFSEYAGGADLAVDGAGRPFVSWLTGGSSRPRVRLLYWDGTGWKALGESATGIDDPDGPDVFPTSVSVTPGGEPVVAWREGPWHDYSLRFRMWQAARGRWSETGLLAEHTLWNEPLVKVGRDNHVFISWYEGSPSEITAKDCVLDNDTWTLSEMGVSVSESAGFSTSPSMAIDDRGYPVIGWAELTGDVVELFSRRWTGLEWQAIPGAAPDGGITLNDGTYGAEPAIAVSGRGGSVLAWAEIWSGKTRCCVRRRLNPAPVIQDLEQRRLSNADTIPPGGITWGDAGFAPSARIISPDTGTVRLQLEVKPIGTAFTGTPTASSTTGVEDAVVRLPINGLAPGRYHWQARAINNAGITTDWESLGGNPDFNVRGNAAPEVASSSQRDPERNVDIAVGGTIRTRGEIMLLVSAGDPDGDAVVVEVELKPLGQAFEGRATGSTGGAEARLLVPVTAGAFHWQLRVLDIYGGASAWTSFGGNAESAADFITMADGSIGPASCVSSAPGGAGLIATLAFLLVRRRRASPGK